MVIQVAPLTVKATDGHTAGLIYSGHIFRKQLVMANMLQSPRGWTISKDLIIEGRPVKLEDLPRYGVDIIQIHVKDVPASQNLYVASFKNFIENGLDVNRKTGWHKALALPFWKVMGYYGI